MTGRPLIEAVAPGTRRSAEGAGANASVAATRASAVTAVRIIARIPKMQGRRELRNPRPQFLHETRKGTDSPPFQAPYFLHQKYRFDPEPTLA